MSLIDAPNFSRLVDEISQKNALQKKSIHKMLERGDDRYFAFAESVVTRMLKAVDRGECFDYLAGCYVWYTKLLRIEEMHYAQKGRYRYDDFNEVYEKVYGRDDYMFDYVVGLGLTQPLWPNHYRIFRFYLDEFVPTVSACKTGAEIGVGHGLFHAEAMRGAPNLKTTLLDISPTALDMTRRMLAATGLDPERATPVLVDVQKEIPLAEKSLDLLLMGELIEHLQAGEQVMRAMAGKMTRDGICYFSTAANAPAEDHILLFTTTDEIRDFVRKCGWSVEKEKVFTLGGISEEQANADKQTLNYCAVLKAARN
jgi:SAM-dependent methyltransferase